MPLCQPVVIMLVLVRQTEILVQVRIVHAGTACIITLSTCRFYVSTGEADRDSMPGEDGTVYL